LASFTRTRDRSIDLLSGQVQVTFNPLWETSASGPFDRWPTGDGFERFYGFLSGETNQWQPTLFEGTTPVPMPDDPNYHFSEDLTTKTISYVREQKAMMPDKPFFVYLSYRAVRAPHSVGKEWTAKYRGKFDAGWDKLREQTFARQKQLSVIPQDCQHRAAERNRGALGRGRRVCRSAIPVGLDRLTK